MSHLVLKQGGTWTTVFRWERYGEPMDLTGCHAAMQLRPRTGGDAALDLTDENGGLVIDEAAGTVAMNVASADSLAVPPGDYLTDQKVIYPDGHVVPTATFTIEVVEAQTR